MILIVFVIIVEAKAEASSASSDTEEKTDDEEDGKSIQFSQVLTLMDSQLLIANCSITFFSRRSLKLTTFHVSF